MAYYYGLSHRGSGFDSPQYRQTMLMIISDEYVQVPNIVSGRWNWRIVCANNEGNQWGSRPTPFLRFDSSGQRQIK